MVAVTEQQQEAQEESPKADSGATAITSEDGVKQAKQIRARTADGKLVELPIKHAAKTLPKTSDKGFPCTVEF